MVNLNLLIGIIVSRYVAVDCRIYISFDGFFSVQNFSKGDKEAQTLSEVSEERDALQKELGLQVSWKLITGLSALHKHLHYIYSSFFSLDEHEGRNGNGDEIAGKRCPRKARYHCGTQRAIGRH